MYRFILFVAFLSLSLNASPQTWRTYLDSCTILQNKNDYHNSFSYAKKAYDILKIDSFGTLAYAESCNMLGLAHHILGEYEKAEPLYHEAKRTNEQLNGKDSVLSMNCHNIGSLYQDMGQKLKAEAYYLEAYHIRKNVFGTNHPKYANTCNSLAGLYNDMGLYQKSELLYLEARAIREKLFTKMSNEYANTTHWLAFLYHKMGQIQKAETLYIESKDIFEKLGSNYAASFGFVHNGMGLLYHDLKEFDKAEASYKEAMRIFEKVFNKNHPYYAQACHNLGLLYWSKGQYVESEKFYLEALAIREKSPGKNTTVYALNCDVLGKLYQYTGQYDKAEKLHLEAKAIREDAVGKGHPSFVINCFNLFTLYWLLNQPEKADLYLKEGFNSKSKDLNNLFQFATENEKLLHLKVATGNSDGIYSFYSTAAPNKAGLAYENSIFYRNLVMSSVEYIKSSIVQSKDTVLKQKYEDWVAMKAQLAYWNARPINQRKVNMVSLEDKANMLEKELTFLSSSFKELQERRKITWKDIQNNLKEDECAIEFTEFTWFNKKTRTDTVYYAAIILNKGMEEPKMVLLCERRQLQSMIPGNTTGSNANIINAFYKGESLEKAAMKENNPLYHYIWKPLEKYLQNTKRIYYAPAGLLYRISFAAIPIDNEHYLSDKYQLVQLSNTASIIKLDDYLVNKTDRIQLYGGISYNVDSGALKKAVFAVNRNTDGGTSLPSDLTRGDNWADLPGTLKEIENIEQIGKSKGFSVTSYKAVQATEESFKALDMKKPPAVIHIATHGFFFQDPEEVKNDNHQKFFEVLQTSENPLFRSGLLFAGANNAWKGRSIQGVEDGILISYEVSNMYIPGTKLVVLSACETGLGDIQKNEGVLGLQRAFKMAGVPNIIMSLWRIPDNETSEFMQLFYKLLFSNIPVSEAFYHAQEKMKKKYRGQAYKWAGLVLVR